MNREYEFKRWLVSINNTKEMPTFLAFRNLSRAIEKFKRAVKKEFEKLFKI